MFSPCGVSWPENITAAQFVVEGTNCNLLLKIDGQFIQNAPADSQYPIQVGGTGVVFEINKANSQKLARHYKGYDFRVVVSSATEVLTVERGVLTVR